MNTLKGQHTAIRVDIHTNPCLGFLSSLHGNAMKWKSLGRRRKQSRLHRLSKCINAYSANRCTASTGFISRHGAEIWGDSPTLSMWQFACRSQRRPRAPFSRCSPKHGLMIVHINASLHANVSHHRLKLWQLQQTCESLFMGSVTILVSTLCNMVKNLSHISPKEIS